MVKRSLEIEVFPENIPDEIVLNVDALKIGDSVRIKDITSDKYEVLGDPEDVICRVEAPHVATAEEEAAEALEEEEAAEPEVVAKGKEAKEGEEE